MGDNGDNKELKQKLNFSYSEEEQEDEGQKEAQESKKVQYHTPERCGHQDSEAKLTPPRTPLNHVCELSTPQVKDRASPDQGLRTPVSRPHTRPETPAPPDKSKPPPHCESPFTPRVSAWWGKREPGC